MGYSRARADATGNFRQGSGWRAGTELCSQNTSCPFHGADALPYNLQLFLNSEL